MKIKLLKLACILALSFSALAGCDSVDTVNAGEQQIYFEVSYANNAWGNQFRGFIIDRDGKIRRYDNPVKWNPANATMTLSSGQIKENILNTTLSPVSIVDTDLQNFISKSASVSDTSYSKPISGGADRGITSYYLYRYDQETKTYHSVLIRQTGDIETFNKDKSAIEISDWLSEIAGKVY
jgi:hypothetical protein